MKEIIPIACDHAGYELKIAVIEHLETAGYQVRDYGTNSTESCDYPDFAHKVGFVIDEGLFSRGIVICGSGNGVQMTVNKYRGVRCALCWNVEIAHLARQHNDSNVLSLPARFISKELAMQIVDEFMNTDFEGGRHQRRVEKINKILTNNSKDAEFIRKLAEMSKMLNSVIDAHKQNASNDNTSANDDPSLNNTSFFFNMNSMVD